MEKGTSVIQTGTNTKVSLKEARPMGKEFTTGIQEKFTMENGNMGSKKEMASGKE